MTLRLVCYKEVSYTAMLCVTVCVCVCISVCVMYACKCMYIVYLPEDR